MQKNTKTPLKSMRDGYGRSASEYIVHTVTYGLDDAGEPETYEITLLLLKPGARLYTASRKGLKTNHNGWFGIKKEDVIGYGSLLEIFEVTDSNEVPPLLILDLSREYEENKIFAEAICAASGDDKAVSVFRENWGGNRQTYRSGDYLVARILRNTLPNFGILGFGTGRGDAYEDTPVGHHSEICLFPSAYANLIKTGEERDKDAGESAMDQKDQARIDRWKREAAKAERREKRQREERTGQRSRRRLNEPAKKLLF